MQQQNKIQEEINKEREITTIFRETKEAFNRNLKNVDKIDSKLVQLFTFITALILLFINFIKFPSNVYLIIIYILASSLFLIALFGIILAYKPQKYYSVDCNKLITQYVKGEYKSNIDLIKSLCGEIASDINSIKENKEDKTKIFAFCSYLSVAGLILIIILKIFQGA